MTGLPEGRGSRGRRSWPSAEHLPRAPLGCASGVSAKNQPFGLRSLHLRFQASCRLGLGPRNRIGLAVHSQPNLRGGRELLLVPPLRCFACLCLCLSGSAIRPMEVWGGQAHQVRLRRRRGTGAGETARSEPAPRPPQVKPPLPPIGVRCRAFSPSRLARPLNLQPAS